MKKGFMILLAGTLMLSACKDRKSEKMQQAQMLLEELKKVHEQLQTNIKDNPYSKQLERDLTEARRVRDSLQVEFDTQCAKIKYLHRKQKQP